ncbi:uncharacterized protein LOC119555566 [Drosophila subpulchrella]|uniref:uncharacterized protein LOC119555566 n=1 Tax=Drosophila subpulchrella TaxID=1486046 RepID=UPI0018A1311F|nr:uncharacterized protein LOC119555566 [Drosophila subpulchrella]
MVNLSIFNLNDDCLHHILKYLSVKDLVNLAECFTRFRQIILDRSPALFPVFHGKDPVVIKPVLYYSSVGIKLIRAVNNNVKTLGVTQGHTYDKEDLGNVVKDFRILTKAKNKIDLQHCLDEIPKLEDIFRFSSDACDYLSVNVPSCICYLQEFFQLIPDLRELLLLGYAKCSDCVKVILKSFPKLDELWIRGACLKLRSDYELISQISSLTKLSLNVGGPNCLAPLANLTELRTLYVDSIFSYISPGEIIEIIKNCKKLEFLYCYYIDHGQQPHDSIGNLFRRIKSHRDPSFQSPLKLHTYMDPPLSEANEKLIDNAYFEYRQQV